MVLISTYNHIKEHIKTANVLSSSLLKEDFNFLKTLRFIYSNLLKNEISLSLRLTHRCSTFFWYEYKYRLCLNCVNWKGFLGVKNKKLKCMLTENWFKVNNVSVMYTFLRYLNSELSLWNTFTDRSISLAQSHIMVAISLLGY